jgi:pimeloyl-ACP methyl ester carboxylesterase
MFVELLGRQVHTVTWGPGPRTVVGIAGGFGTCEIWQQPFELLGRRHRVIAYDHFGAGATRVPPDCVTFASQVALVEALLDAFSVDRCVLAGDSSMITVAIEAARRWPDRCEGLALVAGGVVHEADDVTTRFVRGLRERFEPTLEAFTALCVPEPGSEHLREWLADIIRRTGGERAAALVESFYGIDLRPVLGELSVPTVIVHGDRDSLPVSSVGANEEMAALIRGARLVTLAGAGHVPTLTRPHEVAAAIESLLN